ncbi:MAG: hypothetical protein ACR65R_14525 [Methylomicrobium sp.]
MAANNSMHAQTGTGARIAAQLSEWGAEKSIVRLRWLALAIITFLLNEIT